MATRLVLHIGTQKSGTTYLQRVMQNLAPALRDQGVHYPTRIGGPREVYNHEAAAYGLLGREAFPWVPEERASAQAAVWAKLVEQVGTWAGPAVVSGEALSVITQKAARQLIDALAVPETHVVITARDLGRVLPSSWQQHIRNGRSTSFSAYLRQLASSRGEGSPAERSAAWETDPDQTFWRAFAIGSLVNRWAPLAKSVTVVPVPRRGDNPHELWQRFAASLDLGDILPNIPPEIDTVSANVGITEPETLVLAGLNRQARDIDIAQSTLRSIRGRIVRDGFVSREERGNPVRLPADWVHTIRGWADDDVTELLATTAALIGPADDLRVPEQLPVAGAAEVDQVAAAAGAAIFALNQPEPEPPAQVATASSRRRKGRRRLGKGRRENPAG